MGPWYDENYAKVVIDEHMQRAERARLIRQVKCATPRRPHLTEFVLSAVLRLRSLAAEHGTSALRRLADR